MTKVLILGKIQRFIVRYFALFFQICEIANQIYDYVFASVITHFSQPLRFYVFKTLTASDIEDKEDATTSLIKTACNGPETFLSCRVPNLQLHVCLLFNNHAKIAELDTDCHTVVLCEFLVSETLEDACFPNACVTKDDDFKKYIEVVHNSLKISIILYRDTGRQIVDLGIEFWIELIHFDWLFS